MSTSRKTPPVAPTLPKRPTGAFVRKVAPLIPVLLPLAYHAAHLGQAGQPTPTAITVSTSITGKVGPASRKGMPGAGVPLPLLAKGQPVEWFFVFKLNASTFPLCGMAETSAEANAGAAAKTAAAATAIPGEDTRTCLFGGTAQTIQYPFGQRFVYASSAQPKLTPGGAPCMGDSTDDPVGATFDEVYNGHFHYLIWNDQFHDLGPAVQNCSSGECGAPWGHSKGMLAWNDAGEGFVMQVSTPSWPGSGSPEFQRASGNTLGCIKDDDDVEVSQHFFALHLTKADLLVVLRGLQEASVTSDVPPAAGGRTQYADIGNDPAILAAVGKLGLRSPLTTMDPAVTGHGQAVTLSSGVKFIAKPSLLPVPPWQMVSSVLGGESLRVASWWADPKIYSTTAGVPGCWDISLPTAPGAVEIATSGTWDHVSFNLIGNPSANHAKVGVSTSGTVHYAIFGDENQQGSSDPKVKVCTSSQNGRGGTFFAVNNATLAANVAGLIAGSSAPQHP